ncbi:hypothetical protein CC86DRAFT_131299 [Ophiobolus disseminans]|uniref:Uncharacterized protein n=1 Tax=Ophiobolus disseminans TaxID=1469910 RepID=A0A6A6ZEW9_9PLEO|nr:hypothetical protein CC86DRAFT_131299 [Ophiobolus disseminans]
MRVTSIIIPLSLAAYCSAWAQAKDGTWVANDVAHIIRGAFVHEACTRMNTNDYWKSGPCAYWADNSNNNIFHGSCVDWRFEGRTISCSPSKP